MTANRYAFTRAVPRPAPAGALLATTLFLTPRDDVALVALAPFIRSRRFLIGVAVVAAVAIAANAALYALPLPYAGYLYGTAAAQSLTGEPSLTPRFWVGLPAILFDQLMQPGRGRPVLRALPRYGYRLAHRRAGLRRVRLHRSARWLPDPGREPHRRERLFRGGPARERRLGLHVRAPGVSGSDGRDPARGRRDERADDQEDIAQVAFDSDAPAAPGSRVDASARPRR